LGLRERSVRVLPRERFGESNKELVKGFSEELVEELTKVSEKLSSNIPARRSLGILKIGEVR
jgi:hypothetical protein